MPNNTNNTNGAPYGAIVDSTLLEIISHLHAAKALFGDWQDLVRRDRAFWTRLSEDILRIDDNITDAARDTAYILGMKLDSDMNAALVFERQEA